MNINNQRNDLPVLVLITLVLFALKAIWAVLISTGPLVIDELVYKFNARSIFDLQKYYTAHYPPAYSLALAPAFFLKDWYEAMLVINAFLSSLVVPAAWFLACSAGIRRPLLAAAIAALIPLHFVFPNILFSENLFVPLFALAAALALRGGRSGNAEALIFGVILGITHLTKYLFLPALPLLLATWLYCRLANNKENASETSVTLYMPLILVLLGYGLVVGLWLYYGLSSGFSLSRLFGFGIGIVGLKAKTPTIDSFIMWVVAYSSYVILAWLPVWGIIAIWLSQLTNKDWRIQLEPRHQRFIILFLLLLGCCWLVAVQHSFGCRYNYPVPQRLIGRYLMQLSPIMLVAGLWVLEMITESQAPFRRVKALISMAILICLASISWWILFNKGIWAFIESFANRAPGTVDVIALVSPTMFLLALIMLLLLLAMICVRRNNIRLLVLPIALLMLVSLVVNARTMHARQKGLHYRELATAVTSLNEQGDTLHVLSENNILQRKYFNRRMLFWGVKQNQISAETVSPERDIPFASLPSPSLLISNNLFNLKPMREYIVNDKTYYIYRIDGIDLKLLRPIILTPGKDGK